MRIQYKDLKAGVVKVMVENFDDMWYLSQVVGEGDFVKSKSVRRVKRKDETASADSGERRTITIKIRVKKAQFSSGANSLRILGTVEQSTDDLAAKGSHHSINVEVGAAITIIKEKFTDFDIERLNDAVNSSHRAKMLIVVVDTEGASAGLVRESKIEFYDISSGVGGKYDQSQRQATRIEFYRNTANFLDDLLKRENITSIIIAGAGFEKNSFYDFLSENYRKISKFSIIKNIGSYGKNGIYEILKRSDIKGTMSDLNAAVDVRVVHKLLEHIGTDDGLGIYGIDDVESASDMGAVEIFLVCDNLFVKNRERIEGIMNTVKAARGTVHIVNHENEAGRQLGSLGGVGAIARFRVSY